MVLLRLVRWGRDYNSFVFNDLSLGRPIFRNPGQEIDVVNLAAISGSPDPKLLSSLQNLQNKSEPQVTSRGWADTGRVNEHGDKVVLSVGPNTLYRCPLQLKTRAWP